MKLSQTISGPGCRLRTTVEADAEFILSLRLDPELSRYIGETDPSVEKQRQWIRSKLEQADDYMMTVELLDGSAVGTIAIYDIDPASGRYEWGRWIISPNSPPTVALESALLGYTLAFERLGLGEAVFGVQRANTGADRFHRSFGARLLREDERERWYSVTPELYREARRRFRKFCEPIRHD